MKIKTITQSDPLFLKTAYKYDHMIDLQNHERFIDCGEAFMRYDKGTWKIYRMPRDRIPILLGRYPSLHTAAFHASRI